MATETSRPGPDVENVWQTDQPDLEATREAKSENGAQPTSGPLRSRLRQFLLALIASKKGKYGANGFRLFWSLMI